MFLPSKSYWKTDSILLQQQKSATTWGIFKQIQKVTHLSVGWPGRLKTMDPQQVAMAILEAWNTARKWCGWFFRDDSYYI